MQGGETSEDEDEQSEDADTSEETGEQEEATDSPAENDANDAESQNGLPGAPALLGDPAPSAWQTIKAQIENPNGTEIIEISEDVVADESVTISRKVTIKGSGTIFRKKSDTYDTLFKVVEGGELTLGSGLTLSGKVVDENDPDTQHCPDGETPEYTKDSFTGNGKFANGDQNAPYDPKGFFVEVVDGGKATLDGATLRDFVTSRDKETTPRYVAPVVAKNGGTFNVTSGSITNNIVGYVVDDNMAKKTGNEIKQYIKGGQPNVPFAGKSNFIGEKGVTGTAGAIIYASGAQGTINGGDIGYNRGDTGGVMTTGSGTSITLDSGANINHNVGVQFGGGMTTENGALITMEGGDIESNVGWFWGGGLLATENGVDHLLSVNIHNHPTNFEEIPKDATDEEKDAIEERN